MQKYRSYTSVIPGRKGRKRTPAAGGLKRSRGDSKERAPRSAGRRTQWVALLVAKRMAVAVWRNCDTLLLWPL
jgi:hypothetical protein